MKIGFFDSGLGGLVILKAVSKALPQYDYEFYGDTLNLPFGDKTEEEIYQLTKTGMEKLFESGCVINIIACNTSSAESLRKLQDTFLKDSYPDRKILGVIIPAVEELIDSSAKSTILLATKRTIDSAKYEREYQARSKHPANIHGVAMPKLVPLIEAGHLDEAVEEATTVIAKIIKRVGQVDSVVLGCTHYTLLKLGLEKKFPGLNFISQDKFIPNKLKKYLVNHPEIENQLSKTGLRHVTLTQNRADYDEVIAELLGGS